MNNISPIKVAELIYGQFDYFQRPRSLSNTIIEFAAKFEEQISELTLAENILSRDLQEYISSIVRKEQERKIHGLFCPYEVFPDNDEIVGFSYPRPTDSPMMAKLRQIAPEVSIALETIRELQPNEFELFCSRCLDLLDAKDTRKTQDSKDGGVDFLGWLHIPESFASVEGFPQFRTGFRLLVLGQAKRYIPKNPVGVGEIRELIGTVAAFHHDQLAPWQSKHQLNSFTLMVPILPLIMTTGRISKDARILAQQCGVVTRDGAEIAQFICLEGVGILETEENGVSRLRFDKQKFLEWLHQTQT